MSFEHDVIDKWPEHKGDIFNMSPQERIMTSFAFGREEEERVTSYSLAVVKAESFACTINSTSGRVVASVQVKRE